MPGRAFGKGEHAMFLSPFDPGYDFVPPSGGTLLAEIGIDRHTVLEVIEDERAIRCTHRLSASSSPWLLPSQIENAGAIIPH